MCVCVCVFTWGADNSQQTAWCKAVWLAQGGLLSSRGPKAFVYESGQSTEQQEAFGSIVRARRDYARFKWTQAELNRGRRGQEIVKLWHRLPTFGNQGGQELSGPLLKRSPARSESHKTINDSFRPCRVAILSWLRDLWEGRRGLYWAFNRKPQESCLTCGNVSEGRQRRNFKTTLRCWGQDEWTTSKFTILHLHMMWYFENSSFQNPIYFKSNFTRAYWKAGERNCGSLQL